MRKRKEDERDRKVLPGDCVPLVWDRPDDDKDPPSGRPQDTHEEERRRRRKAG